MQFFLFRHAEKERSFSVDPSLSSRGLNQALALAQLVTDGELSKPTVLLSSPKLRAQQTFQPLAKDLQLRVQITPDLLERQSQESSLQFVKRIKSTIAQVEKLSGVIYAVTHYDWIEDFLTVVSSDTDFYEGAYHSWPSGQLMEFEIKDGLWQLNNFRNLT